MLHIELPLNIQFFFRYLELFTSAVHYLLLDPKAGTQLPCACLHQEPVFLHAAVLD